VGLNEAVEGKLLGLVIYERLKALLEVYDAGLAPWNRLLGTYGRLPHSKVLVDAACVRSSLEA
jgi:hypothetical protein